jgi:hypothetical protein
VERAVDQTDARFSELRFGLGMQPIGHAFKSNPTMASPVLTAIFPPSFRDSMWDSLVDGRSGRGRDLEPVEDREDVRGLGAVGTMDFLVKIRVEDIQWY